MKGIKKAIIGLVAGIVAIFGVAALAACSDNSNNEGSKPQTVTGEYSYANPYAPEAAKYGVKVSVTVDDGKITKVEIVDSEYVQTSDGWKDSTHGKNYIAQENALLQKYVGLDVDDVLAMEIATETNGVPVSNSGSGEGEDTVNPDFDDETFVVDGTDLLIDHATQSCGRLVLAVQNALEKLDK